VYFGSFILELFFSWYVSRCSAVFLAVLRCVPLLPWCAVFRRNLIFQVYGHRSLGMTNYRNGPQRTATEADWGTTDRQELQKRRTELREPQGRQTKA